MNLDDVRHSLMKELESIPKDMVSLIEYIDSIHAHAILSVPVTTHILSISTKPTIYRLTEILFMMELRYGADVRIYINKYIDLVSKYTDTKVNTLLSDEEKALLYRSLSDATETYNGNIYLGTIYLLKALEVDLTCTTSQKKDQNT